jgi:hypothetical protein
MTCSCSPRLLVGTDSGFESTTALYYDTIRVILEAA